MSLLADHLMACSKPTDFYRLQIMAECDALPSEMAESFRYQTHMPEQAANWLKSMRAMMFAEVTAVQPYRKTRMAKNATLYSTRRSPDEPRHLLIACCGLADRLQVPIAVVLQHLDAGQFDVFVLRDPSKRMYLKGIPDYAPDLVQAAERIRRDIDLGAYRSIKAFGTSGGGWAAFALGTLLGADRAISMSGKPPAVSFRLTQMWERRGYSFDDQDADFAAFERLFNGITDRSTRLLAIFGGDYQSDREGAEAFERILDAVGIGFSGVNDHNLMFEILKRRCLASFFRRYIMGSLDELVPRPGQRMVDMEDLLPGRAGLRPAPPPPFEM